MQHRVAIVHDWLVTYAGAERVLEAMLGEFPEADLFSLVEFLPPAERHFLGPRTVQTSAMQRLPFARRRYRAYLPLMPLLIEQFDLTGYDLVISSSHAVAKGVLTGPDTLHICMCYSPMRYAWDLQFQYLRETHRDSGVSAWLARALLHYARLWDCRTANGVDEYIAISHFVARRIRKCYGRASTVIYPPVDTAAFIMERGASRNHYVTSGRLVPYKRVDIMVEAFRRRPDRVLIVIGDGPERERLESGAPPNVRFLGRQPHAVLLQHLQSARAFLFAAEEDFGIAPLEAQACGTPVIACAKGAARETIVGLEDADASGLFFEAQTSDHLLAAIDRFESLRSPPSPEACRRNALRFARDRFDKEFRAFVTRRMEKYLSEVRRIAT